LKGIKPKIWRVILVPGDYSFWDLHVAIQDAMGWMDSHLHQFTLRHPSTGKKMELGIDENEFEDEDREMDWDWRVAKLLTPSNPTTDYWYDFGDDWHHDLLLEGIHPRERGVKYPRCIAGGRACPPEDVGGPYGYQEFLEAMAAPRHERHEEFMEWVGGSFDPEAFSPEAVIFDDPKERLKNVFG